MKSLLIPMQPNMTKEETGFDTVILALDEGTDVDDPQFSLYLLKLALDQAANLGENLKMAQFVFTSDPGEVRSLGLAHDCATCRAGVDQATADLREHPDKVFAVGLLRWCAP